MKRLSLERRVPSADGEFFFEPFKLNGKAFQVTSTKGVPFEVFERSVVTSKSPNALHILLWIKMKPKKENQKECFVSLLLTGETVEFEGKDPDGSIITKVLSLSEKETGHGKVYQLHFNSP